MEKPVHRCNMTDPSDRAVFLLVPLLFGTHIELRARRAKASTRLIRCYTVFERGDE